MNIQKIALANTRVRRIDISEIGLDSLFSFCLVQKKPVLITGFFDLLPELKIWSPEMMKQRLNNKLVSIRQSDTSSFAVSASSRKIAFDEYVNTICDANYEQASMRLYMQQQPIDFVFPELKNDVIFDRYLPHDKIFLKSLWFGPGGNTSPLHFDPFDNFFLQLYGSKIFYLFDPSDYKSLYPGSLISKTPHISGIDPTKVDFDKYPKSQGTTMFEVRVEAGNVLFLPSYWWHQVYSDQLSISVNIWMKTNFYKWVPGALHMLPLNTYGLAMMRFHKFKEKLRKLNGNS